jgi:hypothetical protein
MQEITWKAMYSNALVVLAGSDVKSMSSSASAKCGCVAEPPILFSGKSRFNCRKNKTETTGSVRWGQT